MENIWFKHESVHKYIKEIITRNKKSITKLVKTCEKQNLTNVLVRRGREMGSNHYLVEARIKLKTSEKNKQQLDYT